ncbi:MAG: ABC transporter permease subunit [Chloroflexota bacterium]
MLNNILNIWQKEIMDVLRDRKGLRQMLLIPLFLGFFYALFNPLLGSLAESRRETQLTIPVQGLENAGDDLTGFFADRDIRLETFVGDMETAISRGEEPVGLIFPPSFADQVASGEATTLILRTNNTAGGLLNRGSSLARLELVLSQYNQRISIARLEAANVDSSVLAPITLDVQDLATAAQRAGVFAALFLPLLIATSAVQGGQFIAIDVTAGEKERGTLEALLVTPTSDSEIFVGKLLAVFSVTMLPLWLTLFGFWGATAVLPESFVGVAGGLPLAIIVQIGLATLPLVLFISVVLMLLSIRTKGFKEAQSALSPVALTTIFTSMAGAFVPPATGVFFAIPVYGTASVVAALAQGGIMPTNAVLFSVLGCLVGTAVGIGLALPLFNRERLLYQV